MSLQLFVLHVERNPSLLNTTNLLIGLWTPRIHLTTVPEPLFCSVTNPQPVSKLLFNTQQKGGGADRTEVWRWCCCDPNVPLKILQETSDTNIWVNDSQHSENQSVFNAAHLSCSPLTRLWTGPYRTSWRFCMKRLDSVSLNTRCFTQTDKSVEKIQHDMKRLQHGAHCS